MKSYWNVCWIILVGLVLSTYLPGCHDDCKTGKTRCNGEKVETCNTETDWELSANCAKVEDFGLGISWTCCFLPEIEMHTCLPAEECSALADAGIDSGVDSGDGGE